MNCPLCKSTVLYVGLTTIECKGRKCQNFKGEKITKLTREYLREFSMKVSLKTGKPWSMKDIEHEGAPYVEITGLVAYPLTFIVAGEFTPDIETFEEWVVTYNPEWASCL